MKKLCLVLGLAGLLSMPSIVFGEATWYGSFRGGVESAGGSSHMFSNGSRWGVRGSNEISEGLTANYRYEEALDLATASLATGNRLSYVGLSGGFGTISIGRIWSASFNSVGAILDNSWVYGSSHTSYRVGPAVSYSNSAGAASLQVDLVMDGDNAAKSGVDAYEFGLSFDLGAATLAFAHRKRNHAAMSTTTTEFVPGTAGTPTMVVVTPGTPGTPTDVDVTPGTAGTPTQVTPRTGTPNEPGTPGTPTLVTVHPGMDEIPAVTELREGTSDTLLLTFNNPDDALPIAGVDQNACNSRGLLWVPVTAVASVAADGTNTAVTTAACYDPAHGVTLTKNPIKSALGATGETDAGEARQPLLATGVNRNAHRSAADCAATSVPDGEGGTDTRTAGVWEPNTGMCYPASTDILYLTQAAREAEDRVPAVAPRTEVTQTGTAGTAGTAGTPTEVDVEPGTAGEPTVVTVVDGTTGTVTEVEVTPGTPSTPSTMVTTTTTTPAYDDTMNAVAVRFAAGSHSAAVGLVKTSDSMGGESSTTIANAGGPLSDGLSYNFMVRDTEGSGSNPWVIGLAKSLGGGSTVVLEHGDAGDENSTAVYLQVDF